MRRICISMSFCPTQVSKGVEILDRSVALHEKSQNDIRRSPLQLSNCKSNGKFETRNKIETVVASRVLMNMELVEGEKMLTVFGFFIRGDSSSSSSSPSVNQVHLHHPSTKGVSGVLLVCLKQQASTKIHFRAKIFREKSSQSEAE